MDHSALWLLSAQDGRSSLGDHAFLADCCSIYLHCNEMWFPVRGWLLVFIERLIAEELQKQQLPL